MDAARLTPRKVEALEAMMRGPLHFEPDVGWSNEWMAEPFNTHTMVWLAAHGLCTLYDDRKAVLTRAGRQALDAIERVAA